VSQPAGATAFLALWNGIADAARQDEYEQWHTFEHVPERVGLPGFIAARRYRSIGSGTQPPVWFTLYWLESLAAMNTPAYQQVFATPTRWTARMRSQLTDFLRLPCRLEAAHGVASASRLATLHFSPTVPDPQRRFDELLAEQVRVAGLVSAHCGLYTETAAIPIANRADGSRPQPGRDRVVLLHGPDSDALRAQADTLVRLLAAVATPSRPAQWFELLTEVRRENLPAAAGRRPPRDDLFERYASGDKP